MDASARTRQTLGRFRNRELSSLSARPLAACTGLALALFAASAGTAQQYGGRVAAATYLVGLLVLTPVIVLRLVPRLAERLSESTAIGFALATFAVLVAAFAVLYPLADSGRFGGGSDRDDAANLATSRLLALEYPYTEWTYLEGPISQLPGALFLAAPFVLLGNSAYQTFFWLAILFLALRSRLRDARYALLAIWVVIVASPGVARELVTGGDLISNSISLLVLGGVFVAWIPQGLLLLPGRVAVSALLGLALSWRANFVFLLPLALAAVAARHGRRRALVDGAVVAAAATSVTLPFYLYDRAGFTPRFTSGFLRQYENVLPHAAPLLLVVALLLSLALAAGRANATDVGLARNAAFVQGFFIAAVVVFGSLEAGTFDVEFLLYGYGLGVVFFALVAVWLAWFRREAGASEGAAASGQPLEPIGARRARSLPRGSV